MVAKEFYSEPDQEAGNEESTLLQDPYEEEEEDEALSLCDLPIYSDAISAHQWGDFSKEDGKNYSQSNDNDDDDLFEFFSEEFTTSTTTTTLSTAENIVFCGKLIPFKDHPHAVGKKKKSSGDHARLKKGQEQEESKGSNSKSFECDYKSMGKVSLVRSTTKSRWFLFMFGMSKLSTNEMQLRDIRNRQSRRAPATMFPAPENGKEVKVKGMWKMLRSMSLLLGCRSSKLANDVVKAAFV